MSFQGGYPWLMLVAPLSHTAARCGCDRNSASFEWSTPRHRHPSTRGGSERLGPDPDCRGFSGV